MTFSLRLTPAQKGLVERTHAFAEDVIRPVAAEYDPVRSGHTGPYPRRAARAVPQGPRPRIGTAHGDEGLGTPEEVTSQRPT